MNVAPCNLNGPLDKCPKTDTMPHISALFLLITHPKDVLKDRPENQRSIRVI